MECLWLYSSGVGIVDDDAACGCVGGEIVCWNGVGGEGGTLMMHNG